MKTKNNIRTEILQKRKTVNHSQASSKIYTQFISSDYYKKSTFIMSYVNIGSEVQTESINKKIVDDDKTLLLPVLQNNEIKPSNYRVGDNFKVGEFNVPEPSPFRAFDKNTIQVLLVPGVAFDKKGYRLGYGKGYFDRFLKDFKGIKIGLCYNVQLIDEIPVENHDIKMDLLITEDKIYSLTSKK